jgi:hypothetical protein
VKKPERALRLVGAWFGLVLSATEPLPGASGPGGSKRAALRSQARGALPAGAARSERALRLASYEYAARLRVARASAGWNRNPG